ncbi:MAG: hypothetical protein JWO80_1804 [Bryobacterales bacterium]|nr:hypothetical protein [Bryobacterales bacterium]
MFDGYRNSSGMRRAFASLLLAIFSFPLIAPSLLTNAISELPSCCRRGGKHRCAMAEKSGQVGTPNGPVLNASQPKCPLFPKAQVVPASKTILLSGAPRVCAPYLFYLTTARHHDHRPRIVSRDPIRKRGPPPSLDQTNRISL